MIQFNKVTWYSKLAAVILFALVIPALVVYIDKEYEKTLDVISAVDVSVVPVAHPSKSIATSTVVSLKLNEKAVVDGITIEPWAVLQDSRCPSNVQCIQAGKVSVGVHVYPAKTSPSLVFEVGKTITVDTHKITLVSVDPYPISTHKTQDNEWIFVFKVEKDTPLKD